jgi:hypothetical protein
MADNIITKWKNLHDLISSLRQNNVPVLLSDELIYTGHADTQGQLVRDAERQLYDDISRKKISDGKIMESDFSYFHGITKLMEREGTIDIAKELKDLGVKLSQPATFYGGTGST